MKLYLLQIYKISPNNLNQKFLETHGTPQL